MSWLEPVVTALDAATERRDIFFRDDDAGWASERLFAMLDLFERHALGVDVAVIPMELGASLVRSLYTRASDGGVRLHQHGYAHVNHETEGRKHEFGPSRDAFAQTADIVAGQHLLEEAFGDRLDPAFTPPWNRCTPVTGPALLAAGVRVLSQDTTAPRQELSGLVEIPITVDWFAHRKGVRLTSEQLGERVAASVQSGGPVGVMLHHELTDAAELAALDDLLGLVAKHPMARPTTLIELAG